MCGTIFIEVIVMKEDKLSELSMQLSVDVLKLVKDLQAKHETVISKQISRSATNVCANIAESKYGHSRADFIAKLEIALKEANETAYWLKLIKLAKKIDTQAQQFVTLESDCVALKAMLVSSIKTAKQGSE